MKLRIINQIQNAEYQPKHTILVVEIYVNKGITAMNKIVINGRLIREPELKEMEKNTLLCTIFIANDVWFGSNKKTGFYKCQAWGQIGKIIGENAKTGTELFITGRLEQYRYENEKGIWYMTITLLWNSLISVLNRIRVMKNILPERMLGLMNYFFIKV